jgi:tripartite-type tricarboxylate transporter receptor subunit TctC
MNRTIRAWTLAVTGLMGLAGLCAAQAQDYPNRPIKMIVPFSAGGPTDVAARSVAQRMGAILGQPVFVDNRTGAGSTLGTDVVAKAPADGYTLLFGTLSLAINATMYPKLPYDTVNDFAPVGKVVNTYLVLVTTPGFPAHTLKEFIDVMKASPGKYNYGTAGVGSGLHLASEMLSSKVGLQGTHVPYRGNSMVVPALLGGELQYAFLGMDSAVPHIKTGKLRAIAVTSPQRDVALPTVPTFAEAGVPGFEVGVWMVLEAPRGTPPAIVRKLNDALNRSLASPEFAEMAGKFAGMVPMGGSTPESTDAFIREEIVRWAPVIKATGAKPE